ncbi:MAG: hypothetical protein Q8L60_12070 [Gammaproteobacteria bacterium]|nr:hypothetical protein [Gammaproteobacteria bacterium]MDP2141641.1 hypothetical protein [Gammaproteobacteria bacterium]MDP2346362.1 hypothetical protein [Gammaproteobacteria bacterium]
MYEPQHLKTNGIHDRCRFYLGWLLGLAVIVTANAVSADNFLDLGAGIASNSNVTRAFLDSDQYRDVSATLDLTAGRFVELRPGRSVTTFATLSASRFNELIGLNSESIGVGSVYQHKFGLGAYAPTVGAALNWSQHNSRGKTRDRHIAEFELSYSKRLSPAWNTRIGAAHEVSEGTHDGRRYASQYSTRNDIFDFDQTTLFATMDYVFANDTMLALTYTWIDGNTVSSALAPNPRLLGIAKALTLDPAVKAPPGRNQVAYSLASRAHLVALDWSIPLGRDTSLNLGYVRQEIRADSSVDYGNDQFSVTFMLVL